MASLKDLIVSGVSRFVGKIYASGGIEGNLSGNVSGSVTGDLLIGSSGAGGKINGNATNGGSNSILIGDDVWLGDCNIGGTLALKAANSTTQAGVRFYGSGGQNLGSVTNGHASSDLSLSGGTMTGAIRHEGNSYSWYNNQHYNSDGSTFSRYNENAAFITQTNYSGWQAIWQGPNNDMSQWSSGLYANNFYINRFEKGNSNNSPNQQWIFTANGGLTVPGTITGNLSGTADKATKDGSGRVITDTYATKTELSNIKLKVSIGRPSTITAGDIWIE